MKNPGGAKGTGAAGSAGSGVGSGRCMVGSGAHARARSLLLWHGWRWGRSIDHVARSGGRAPRGFVAHPGVSRCMRAPGALARHGSTCHAAAIMPPTTPTPPPLPAYPFSLGKTPHACRAMRMPRARDAGRPGAARSIWHGVRARPAAARGGSLPPSLPFRVRCTCTTHFARINQLVGSDICLLSLVYYERVLCSFLKTVWN